MAIYILGTQCLLDIAKKDGNKAQQWFEALAGQGIQFGDVCISALSIAQLRFFFDKHPPATPGDRQLQANVALLTAQFETADAVIGLSVAAAKYWAHSIGENLIYHHPRQRPMGTEALVLATVAVGHQGTSCTLADRLQPVHTQLGITVHDPY